MCVCGEFDWQTWGQVSEYKFLEQKIKEGKIISILGGEAGGCELGGHPEGHKTLPASAQGDLSDKNRGAEDGDKHAPKIIGSAQFESLKKCQSDQ